MASKMRPLVLKKSDGCLSAVALQDFSGSGDCKNADSVFQGTYISLANGFTDTSVLNILNLAIPRP